jgi:hypothetical protein
MHLAAVHGPDVSNLKPIMRLILVSCPFRFSV